MALDSYSREGRIVVLGIAEENFSFSRADIFLHPSMVKLFNCTERTERNVGKDPKTACSCIIPHASLLYKMVYMATYLRALCESMKSFVRHLHAMAYVEIHKLPVPRNHHQTL
tara:strand:+ start:1472 stop:1810 length:339 start_codon:yes stop_codon:yes gene_type:complete